MAILMSPHATGKLTSSSTIISRKRSQEAATTVKEFSTEKTERMDPARKKQCHLILKKLMDIAHDLLPKHLDLRKIERKLDCGAYPTTSQFALDVKLALASPTLPTDEIHIKAKELNDLFDESWQKRNKWWIDMPKLPQEKKQKVTTVDVDSVKVKEQGLQTHQYTIKTKASKPCKYWAAISQEQDQPANAHRCSHNSRTLQPSYEQISPSKAAYIARTKPRLADTIIKAQKTHQDVVPADQKVDTLREVENLEEQHEKEKTSSKCKEKQQIKKKREKARSEYKRKLQIEKKREAARIDKLYTDVVVNWNPPPIQFELSDDTQDDWLFGSRQRKGDDKEVKTNKAGVESSVCENTTMASFQPRACYVTEIDAYALPYVAPF